MHDEYSLLFTAVQLLVIIFIAITSEKYVWRALFAEKEKRRDEEDELREMMLKKYRKEAEEVKAKKKAKKRKKHAKNAD